MTADETTIAEMLKSAGDTTAHYGKWHLSGGGPEKHSYDPAKPSIEKKGKKGEEKTGGGHGKKK